MNIRFEYSFYISWELDKVVAWWYFELWAIIWYSNCNLDMKTWFKMKQHVHNDITFVTCCLLPYIGSGMKGFLKDTNETICNGHFSPKMLTKDTS